MTAPVPPPRTRGDLLTVLGALVLFALAALVGHDVQHDDGTILLRWPPLYGYAEPHLGPGTPLALAVAAGVVGYGPALAHRLRWRTLLAASWCGAMAWTWSLALVDGWHRGVARRLTTRHEYLRSVDEVDNVGATLRTFTDHILMDAPENWPAHVAGHPPGALLTFVGLDRVGLGGGAWAGVWCVTVSTTAVVAVLLTIRALSGEELARRTAPFLVLLPAAVWYGVSADGYFTAVAAWALALLALAATRAVRRPWAAALGSGALFGLLCYLSYGLVLMAVLAAAVLLTARTARPVPWVVLGALPWVALFTACGFWWLDGYLTLVERYYQGAAGERPYAYFVWANLAAQVVTVGLATVAALRHTALAVPAAARAVRVGAVRIGEPSAGGQTGLVVLVAGALCALLIADLSGMSKAETERIWLPFTLWLLPATALLPDHGRRWWLAAQATVPLLVNHLLFTGW